VLNAISDIALSAAKKAKFVKANAPVLGEINHFKVFFITRPIDERFVEPHAFAKLL
jgi:hypothetical protein